MLDIYQKDIQSTQSAQSTQYADTNTMPKTTKHRIEDNEYIMHKMQKLDELELQKILTPVQGGNADSYQLKELDFDIESFIKEISTMTASVSAIPLSLIHI